MKIKNELIEQKMNLPKPLYGKFSLKMYLNFFNWNYLNILLKIKFIYEIVFIPKFCHFFK